MNSPARLITTWNPLLSPEPPSRSCALTRCGPYLIVHPPIQPGGQRGGHERPRSEVALPDDSTDAVLALCHCVEEAVGGDLGEVGGGAHGEEQSLQASSCCGGHAGVPGEFRHGLQGMGGAPGRGRGNERINPSFPILWQERLWNSSGRSSLSWG